MAAAYVDLREGEYCIRGSRVSLDSIVQGFLNGESPETIRDNFCTLKLEQVYGAITYYLAHEDQVNAHLKVKKSAYEEARKSQAHIPGELRERIGQSRQQLA